MHDVVPSSTGMEWKAGAVSFAVIVKFKIGLPFVQAVCSGLGRFKQKIESAQSPCFHSEDQNVNPSQVIES